MRATQIYRPEAARTHRWAPSAGALTRAAALAAAGILALAFCAYVAMTLAAMSSNLGAMRGSLSDTN